MHQDSKTQTDRPTRPSLRFFKIAETDRTEASAPDLRPTRLDIAAAAIWFGVIAGVLELGVILAQNMLGESNATFAWLRTNRHFLWMIPLANIAVFGVFGGLLSAAPRSWARRPWLALALLSALGPMLTIRGLHIAASLVLACGLAFQAARLIQANPSRFQKLVRFTLPALLGVLALMTAIDATRVLSAERRGLNRLSAAASDSPNVLMIVMDTVRADHLSLYGYQRDTSPNLTKLAQRGVRFDQARSAAPWTLPSHATMFTGRWPHELRVNRSRTLGSHHTTLAEFLRDRGYLTGGFVANTFFCNSWFGLDEGFLHYEDYPETTQISPPEILRHSTLGRIALGGIDQVFRTRLGVHNSERKSAEQINRDLLDWLPTDPGRPFFVFLNYFDAHSPYLLPEGNHRRFGLTPESDGDQRMLKNWDQSNPHKLTDRDRRMAFDAYDDCIAYLDDQIGCLFDALQARGQLRNTIVIVTSDHGEAFGEHQLFGHGLSLYRPEVHVPLLIIDPRDSDDGRSVRDPVSLRDLPATVASLLGFEADSPFPGGSLMIKDEDGDLQSRPILSEADSAVEFPFSLAPAKRGPMHSFVASDRVYIRNAGGREELYDLDEDIAEESDLSGASGADVILEGFRSLSQSVRGDRP